jgi:PilZ domain
VVISGNYRNRAELRKKPRRQFHYAATIVADESEPLSCTISDISHSGARLVLENDDTLPDRFLLLLTRTGDARRRCRVIWRTGVSVGVEFATD